MWTCCPRIAELENGVVLLSLHKFQMMQEEEVPWG